MTDRLGKAFKLSFKEHFPSGLAEWSECLLLGVVYFVTAKVGQLLAVDPGNVTAVWIPSGIILTALLTRGYYLWPGVFLGAFSGNIWVYIDVVSLQGFVSTTTAGLSNGVGDVFCAVIGAWGIRRYADTRHPFTSLRGVVIFLLSAVIAGSAVSAIFGVTSLAAMQILPWEQYQNTVITWFTGDGVGIIILTPLLVSLVSANERTRFNWEHSSFYMALIVVVSHSMGCYVPPSFRPTGLKYPPVRQSLMKNIPL